VAKQKNQQATHLNKLDNSQLVRQTLPFDGGQQQSHQHLQHIGKAKTKNSLAKELQVININSRISIVQCYRTTEKEALHTTLGLALLGLDEYCLSICSLLCFSSGLTL